MADTFKYFLYVFHEAVVVDRFWEADVAEVTLTFSWFAAGLADLVGGGDAES